MTATLIPRIHTANLSQVLSVAVARIAEIWQVPNAALGTILRLSAPTNSRLRTGACTLDLGGKPFELG